MAFAKLFMCVTAAAVGARVRSENTNAGQGQVGEVGEVDYLFTTGCPALAKPSIKNAKRRDGCFRGKRVWSRKGEKVDLVPGLPYIVGFKHALTDGVELDQSKQVATEFSCSSDLLREPSMWGTFDLHSRDNYQEPSAVAAPGIHPYTVISSGVGMSTYLNDGKDYAEKIDWGVVARAYDGQVTYLLQNPDTLECAVTFQGTKNLADALLCARASSVEFCGLSGTEVHQGFRDRLMMMMRSEEWQANILPKLGRCSSVTAAGQSLGGAQATLFAACVNNAPAEGSAGYDEYKFMKWTKDIPELLPNI
eukprot:402539_1